MIIRSVRSHDLDDFAEPKESPNDIDDDLDDLDLGDLKSLEDLSAHVGSRVGGAVQFPGWANLQKRQT